MPTGLRQVACLNRIVAAMRAVEGTWTSLLPKQRTEAIANAVLAELRLILVAPPQLEVAIFPGLSGQFDFGPWKLQVDQGMAVGKVGQSPIAKIAELGDTITHEARHCEQWYRMARLLAAERRAKGILVDGREIGKRLGINNMAVCNQAAGAAPLMGIEKTEAEDWYNSVYGSQASFREQTYSTQLRPTGLQTGSDWQGSKFARYQRALAEEEDAWSTGTELQNLYLAFHPGVPATQMTRHQPVRAGISTY
jgi:hypothetical protein